MFISNISPTWSEGISIRHLFISSVIKKTGFSYPGAHYVYTTTQPKEKVCYFRHIQFFYNLPIGAKNIGGLKMEKIKIKNYPIGPFPTVLAGAEVENKPNYVTVGACGVVCLEPILYISLKNTHYSTRGIQENGYFSVNIPSAEMVQKTDYCGVVSGNETDKSQVFTAFYDDLGKAPMIAECPLNFLCKVVQSIPVFGFDMFLGEIVAAYIDDRCFTDGKPDPLKIDPMLMMGTGYYNLNKMVGTVYQEGMTLKKPKKSSETDMTKHGTPLICYNMGYN